VSGTSDGNQQQCDRRVRGGVEGGGSSVFTSRRGVGMLRRGRSEQNLIYPRIQRHVARPTDSMRFGLLNIRSIQNKVDSTHNIICSEGLDLMAITETWHEEMGSVSIDRLRTHGYNVSAAAYSVECKHRSC